MKIKVNEAVKVIEANFGQDIDSYVKWLLETYKILRKTVVGFFSIIGEFNGIELEVDNESKESKIAEDYWVKFHARSIEWDRENTAKKHLEEYGFVVLFKEEDTLWCSDTDNVTYLGDGMFGGYGIIPEIFKDIKTIKKEN